MAGPATNSTSTAVKQLSDGNSVGTILGQGTTDPIGFYGLAAGITQPTDPGQAALPVNGTTTSAGVLTHYTSTQTPSSVTTLTTAEQSVTVTGVLATDLVIINKPTSQAGLGLCKGRVSAANTVKLTFANVTAGTLTPTATQAYIVTTIPAALQLSAALTPAAVAASTIAEQTFSVTGLAVGMIVEVNKPTNQAGLAVLSARVSAKNTLALTFANVTAGTLTPTAAETYIISAFNALLPASQVIEHGVNVGTLSSVATVTTSEQSVTVAGVAATDAIIGMSKPTNQAGLGLVSGRVSAASTIQVTFANVTGGTLTPTASEVYNVTVHRAVPVAPMTLYTSAALTPGAVATLTSAEQTFTVTGLVSGQPVAAAPNYNISATPGVGIAGVRVSATDTLAVTFINTTAGSITPPAGSWTVAQFNQTTPTAGNFVQQVVTPIQSFLASLVTQLRAAGVALNLIAGS